MRVYKSRTFKILQKFLKRKEGRKQVRLKKKTNPEGLNKQKRSEKNSQGRGHSHHHHHRINFTPEGGKGRKWRGER